MKAAILHSFAESLRIEEITTPSPGAGEVLIKVAACGVCHSDLHLAMGEWDLLRPITKLPLTLGHEVTGTIASVGEGVAGFDVGDRVGVPWLHWTCGECEFCLLGRETLCSKQQVTGCTVDGGFAEFIKAKASHIARLPHNLTFEEAAPLLCAGLTVHSAMKKSGAQAGQKVAVFGVGGLGHLAIQLAKANGAEVIAVDVADDKLELARECGADVAVNAATTQVHREIKKVTGGGACGNGDVGFARRLRGRAAFDQKSRDAGDCRDGAEPVPLSTVAMVSGEYRIVGSAVGSREELREVLQLAAEGKVKCRTETRAFTEVDSVLDEMKNGRVLGRVVLNF